MSGATSIPVLNNQTIRIRTYTPADLLAVAELFSAGVFSHANAPDQNDAIVKIWLGFIAQAITEDLADIEGTFFASGGHFWVATCVEDNGKEVVVGTVALHGKPDKTFELRRLSVRATYQRYGLGRKLVAHVEQWAKDQGIAKIWLLTGSPMVHVHRLYASIGFTQTKIAVYSENPPFNLVYFEKALV